QWHGRADRPHRRHRPQPAVGPAVPLCVCDDSRPDWPLGRPVLGDGLNGMEASMNSHWPLLSLLIWLPIIGGFATLLFGRERAEQARWFALLVALVALVLSVPLYT